MSYGEHSAKIGGISTAANAGCSAEDIQFQGRYASDRMPKIYRKRSLENKRKVTAILKETLKKATGEKSQYSTKGLDINAIVKAFIKNKFPEGENQTPSNEFTVGYLN